MKRRDRKIAEKLQKVRIQRKVSGPKAVLGMGE